MLVLLAFLTDADEFLYLINLKASNVVNPVPEFSIHEMGFINEVYIHERLDLGLPYNFMHFNLVSQCNALDNLPFYCLFDFRSLNLLIFIKI